MLVTLENWDWQIVGDHYEEMLSLNHWDGDDWQEPHTTCRGADHCGHLTKPDSICEVNVCHLSDFVFAGRQEPDDFLRLGMR